jgi:hypothetical protein
MMQYFFTKMDWATFWAIFTNSFSHPDYADQRKEKHVHTKIGEGNERE